MAAAHALGVWESGRTTMRRMLLGVFALVAAFVSPVSAQNFQWVGFAASSDGRVYRADVNDEYHAREVARNQCQQATMRNCNALSVFTSSDVIVMQCQNGVRSESFLGGSNQDHGAAQWIALNKAQQNGFFRHNCVEVYRY